MCFRGRKASLSPPQVDKHQDLMLHSLALKMGFLIFMLVSFQLSQWCS